METKSKQICYFRFHGKAQSHGHEIKEAYNKLTFSSSNISALSAASYRERKTESKVISYKLIKCSAIFSCYSLAYGLTIMVGTVLNLTEAPLSRDWRDCDKILPSVLC